MKKVFLLAALAVAAMTSCSKEDGNNETETSSGKLISMRAVVDKPNSSRAAGMSTDRFNSFHVLAAKEMDGGTRELNYLNTVVYSPHETQGDRKWYYSPRAYYPADGKGLSFFAYAPVGDRNMSPGSMKCGFDNFVSFEYKVPFNQQSGLAEDLLVSCVHDNKYDGGNPVTYTFNHALSAATFSAHNGNAGGLVYVIHKISITKLKDIGTFTYDENGSGIGEWTSQSSGLDSYIAPIPASGVAVAYGGEKLLSNNDFLIILPQEVQNWSYETEAFLSGTHVEVEFSVCDGSGNLLSGETRNFCIPYGDLHEKGFEPGKRYDFSFTFDTLNAITMEVNTVNVWDDDVPPVNLNPEQ